MNGQLYQVIVETKAGRPLPVGPRVDRMNAERFAIAIRTQIISGAEQSWSNPTVVAVTAKGH